MDYSVEGLQLPMHSKKKWMSLVVSFTIDQRNHGCMITMLKFIQHAIKESLSC